MVAVCGIADAEESISTGSGGNSGFAVEGKPVLYFADEPEIAGQPHIQSHRSAAGVLQHFKIPCEVTILRHIDFARNIQPRDSELRNNHLPPAKFCNATVQ